MFITQKANLLAEGMYCGITKATKLAGACASHMLSQNSALHYAHSTINSGCDNPWPMTCSSLRHLLRKGHHVSTVRYLDEPLASKQGAMLAKAALCSN